MVTKDRKSLNPETITKLAEGYGLNGKKQRKKTEPLHVIQLAAKVDCTPSTIYIAAQLGYLYKVSPAWYAPTARLNEEVDRIWRLQREKHDNRRAK